MKRGFKVGMGVILLAAIMVVGLGILESIFGFIQHNYAPLMKDRTVYWFFRVVVWVVQVALVAMVTVRLLKVSDREWRLEMDKKDKL